jgi:hypothetical protein
VALPKPPAGPFLTAKVLGKEKAKGVLLEDAKRQSYVTKTFPLIFPLVKSVPPAKNLFLEKSTLLGCGPLSHAKAAVQGCDVPDGKDLSDSSYVTFGGNECVSLRKNLEKLQLDIGVCLERMALGHVRLLCNWAFRLWACASQP